jgi:ubiquinone/menaquinone biosynthesis C-methylase UbiE
MSETAYYDDEAPRYDETRGGDDRATSAADALVQLLGAPGRCLDVAGGTGIVSAQLQRAGFDVVVVDLSSGMVDIAAGRLPGRVMVADAARLPVADESVQAVAAIWLLHMLEVDTVDRILAEAVRVLRSGGRFATTVDKEEAHGLTGSGSDSNQRIAAVLGRAGLQPVGTATFTGRSQCGSATDGDPVFTVAAFERTG